MYEERYTLTALLENRPGVFHRTVSLIERRGFSLDNVLLGRTDREDVVRFTIVIAGVRAEAERLQRELGRMVDLIRVELLSGQPAVARHMALIKVAADAECRADLMRLCEVFRARIVDVGSHTVILEQTGDPSKIDSLIEVLRPFGIVEMLRTGPLAMGRGERVLSPGDFTSPWHEHRQALAPSSN